MQESIDPMDVYQLEAARLKNEEFDPNDVYHLEKRRKQSLSKPQGSILDQLKQGLLNIPQNALGIAQGASDALVNLPAQVANIALPKQYQLPTFQSGQGTPYDIGKIGGEIASFPLGGGALNAVRKGAEILPILGSGAKWLGTGIKGVPRRALEAATINAAQNPEDRLESAGVGAGVSVLADALLGGIGRGAPKISEAISKLLLPKSTLSSGQLLENLEAAKGTKTNLGNVIGNPGKQRLYENILTKVPFSGVTEKMGETAHKVKEQGNNLLNEILGNQNPEGFKEAIQQGLKKSYKGTLAKKEKLWNEVNDVADQLGMEVGRENLGREAQNILSEIKQSNELAGEMPNHIVEDLKRYSDESTINNLRLSNIFKGALGTKASKLYKETGKSYEYGIYKRLQEALKRDVEGAIEGSENPALREKYDTAMKFHAQEVAPFEEKEIAKFTRKGGDPDLILSSFLKTGQNDRSELLNKLLKKIPDQKGLVGYGYLSKAIEHGELNPLKLKNIYKSLGEQQKLSLFGKDVKKRLDRYMNLVTMNTKPLTLMANPETGQKALDVIAPILLGHGALGAAGLIAGGGIGGLIGAGTPIPISMYLSHRLTSEKLREKVVKALTEKGTKSIKDRTTQENILKGIMQTLVSEMRR